MPSSADFYPQYNCFYKNPLNCDRPLQTTQEAKGAKFCLECGFPATLSEQVEIKGNFGNYQVKSYVGVRGYGRLYSGIELRDKQAVEIKEYLLPKSCFNQQESINRQQQFQKLGGLKLADDKIQNFRLVNTLEPIADQQELERCYLITQAIESSQTLRQYITQHGQMTPSQVRDVLNQTLQTLEFLHSQKLRFPSNLIQESIAHGNINLDSILIQQKKNGAFQIYLCDLAIWENLFIPPTINPPTITSKEKEKDLESLALVGIYLLVGRTTVDYTSNQPLDPKNHQQWYSQDTHLNHYLERLIGWRDPFNSAESARQNLIKLPKADEVIKLYPSPANEQHKKWYQKWSTWLLILALLLLGGGILAYFLSRPNNTNKQYVEWLELKQNLADIKNVPSGIFDYTSENPSTWTSIIRQKVGDKFVEEILKKPKPQSQTIFQYQTSTYTNTLTNIGQPILEVKTGQKDFAITTLTNQISDELDKKPIAYDGLLVYVEFSKKNKTIVDALDSQITIEQLRQIYTGKIKNWQQINSQLPDLEIRPYAPVEPEAINKFQTIVFNNDPQDQALFKDKVTQLDTTQTQRKIRQEILNGKTTGIIGFGIISKIKGQCAGYPLAIVDDNKSGIQPLFQKRDRRPIKTSDDLCDHDDYFFDVNTFKTYPLGYPIYVVYPKDNSLPPAGSRFADILKTRQGQCLLSKVGLVPLQPIPDDINNYGCKSLS
jgi:serine/threonine protein kinase